MSYSRRSFGVTMAATAAIGALAPLPASATDLPADNPALKLPTATYQVASGDSVSGDLAALRRFDELDH